MIGIMLRAAWRAGALFGCCFCLTLTPATAAPTSAPPTSEASAAPVVTARQAWFRYMLPNIPAGGYLTLENHTPQILHLTGGRSPNCGMLMLHKTVHENGLDKMVAVPAVSIPAHGSFSFRPGFYHIMCMQPHMAVGESVPVTLTFDNAAPLTAEFVVYGAMGKTSGQ